MFSNNKIIPASLLLLAILMTIVGVFVAPLVYNIWKIGTLIKEQDRFLSESDKRIAAVNKFREFRSQNEVVFVKLNESLVAAGMPLNFINFLEEISKNCQVESFFSPAESQKSTKNSLPSVNFKITLKGTFSSSMKFLKMVEAGPYPVEILSYEIKTDDGGDPVQNGDGQKKVQVDMMIKTYAKKDI